MANPLLKTWHKLGNKPCGHWLFSKLLGFRIPYTGTVKPYVQHLEKGKAIVLLKDHRKVRNHLDSIHAIAQMNLAEFCGGLAMTTHLDNQTRAIVTELRMQYHKKARGTLTAKCECPEVPLGETSDVVVSSQIFDESQTLVSEAQAYWRVSPKPSGKS